MLLITLDALRPDHLPVYGNQKIETPNISRVAAEGVVFENAYSQANWTFASMAATFTSRYPDAIYPCRPYLTGFEPDYKTLVKNPMPAELLEKVIRSLGPENLTLAKVLYSYSYRTGAVVSNWFNSSILGIALGFEDFSAAEEMVSRFGPVKRCFLYQIQLPDLISLYARVYALYLHYAVKINPTSSIYINQRAEKFLKRNQNQKFFLWLHYMETHSPFGETWEPTPPAMPGYHGPLQPGFSDVFRVAAGEISLDAADIKYLNYLYDYDLAYADSQLGNLFRFLEQNHLWENTVIIISADHGEQLMEHGRLGHGFNMYQEDLWVPLIIKPAGKTSPRRIREPVQLLDLAPTILDLAGIPIPKSFAGRSLKPLLEGKDGAGDSFIYGACNLLGEPTFSLRQNGYLLVYYSLTDRAELYDLAQDPGNQNDLSGKFPDLARQMLGRLKAAISAHAAEQEQNQTGTNRVKLKPEDVQRLRALGYVK